MTTDAFIQFRDAIHARATYLLKHEPLAFRSSISKEEMHETYLNSYLPEDNPIFRERRTYDCFCCMSFISRIGDLVIIKDGKYQTIWQVEVDPKFQRVADAMHYAVISHTIESVFLSEFKKCGEKSNVESISDTENVTWDHFYFDLPNSYVHTNKNDSIESRLGKYKTNYEVLTNSLSNIENLNEVLADVLDLIHENVLYRGAEYAEFVTRFKNVSEKFSKLHKGFKAENLANLEKYLWTVAVQEPDLCRFKNTVIGTLVIDLAEGVETEIAVKKYLDKVDPEKLNRTNQVYTRKQKEAFEKRAKEGGYYNSLFRREMVSTDLTINNVLYADRSVRQTLGGELDFLNDHAVDSKPKKEKSFQEISVQDFMDKIVPGVTEMEVLFKNSHQQNLMTLSAPVYPDSPTLFKWDNAFSWSYNGDFTDSLATKRVKANGGSVEAFCRCSLIWWNTDDLDLRCTEPNGNIIDYGNKKSRYTGGLLDIDKNVSDHDLTREPVENIIYKDQNKLIPGKYEFGVHNFRKRESIDTGFSIEFELGGNLYNLNYSSDLKYGQYVKVVTLHVDSVGNIKYNFHLPCEEKSQEIWDIKTESFQKVKMLMLSPNYWDGKGVGNKHWFFILDKCKNNGTTRGIYNEYLKSEFRQDRKVFDALGKLSRCEKSDEQLSGLGFSSTKKDSVIVRVKGKQNRQFKVVF